MVDWGDPSGDRRRGVSGSAVFEWLEGGCFLIERSRNNHELFPDAIAVFGPPQDGDGLVMEYFDSRGVRRTYATSIEDGALRIWRAQAGFEQRFEATLAPDQFNWLWQLARVAGAWKDDLSVVYRRAGGVTPGGGTGVDARSSLARLIMHVA